MTTASGHRRRAWLAAVLSFVVPGLGQAYLGYRVLAVILALPVLLLLALGGFVLLGELEGVRNRLLSPAFLSGLFVLNASLLAWRLFAIAHAAIAARAGAGPSPVWRRRAGGALLAVLLLASTGMHAYVGAVVLQLQTTLDRVFAEGQLAGRPGGQPPGPGGEPAPPASPWDDLERTNFLLIGIDAAPGRQTELTDTLLVLSVDPASESAVMVSIPRDTGFVPLADRSLYPDGLYPFKINQLASEASRDPALWCPDMAVRDEADATACGIRTLRDTVGLYLGVPIHYHGRIDFAGFERLIDALGGVELCLPGRLIDPEYTDPTTGQHTVLDLPAGCARYGGADALAYARSRKGWIEHADGTREPQNDFLRAGRQQEILLGLQSELGSGDLIFELPQVLDAIGATVATDFPRSQAGDLAGLAPLVSGPDIERVVLGYPDYVELPANPQGNYLLVPRREAVRERMARLFGADGLSGWYLGTSETP